MIRSISFMAPVGRSCEHDLLAGCDIDSYWYVVFICGLLRLNIDIDFSL